MGDLSPHDIINNTRGVLISNIVITEEFTKELLKRLVFGHAVLKEIKNYPTQEEQNEKLLDQLSLKSRVVLENFSDALQHCGFNLLSEIINNQLTLTQQEQLADIGDLPKRAPKLNKILTEGDKEELLEYIAYKIQERTIKEAWQGKSQDKEKVMQVKKKQVEDSWKFTGKLEEKEKTIAAMGSQLKNTMAEAEERRTHLKHVGAHLEDLKKKHANEMQVQRSFNEANDKLLKRQAETQKELTTKISTLMSRIEVILTEAGIATTPDPDKDDFILTQTDRSTFLIKKLLQYIHDLQAMHTTYDQLKADCLSVLNRMGKKPDSNIKMVFQNFIVESDEIRTKFQMKINQITKQRDEAEGILKMRAETAEKKVRELEKKIQQLMDRLMQREQEAEKNAEAEKQAAVSPQPEKKPSTPTPTPTSRKQLGKRPSDIQNVHRQSTPPPERKMTGGPFNVKPLSSPNPPKK